MMLMVRYFVSDTHKVMTTPFLSCEFWFCEQKK
jgi:hypothetical protein